MQIAEVGSPSRAAPAPRSPLRSVSAGAQSSTERYPAMREVRPGKKAAPPTLLTRVRLQVQKLPDPTLLFLAHTALILALRAFAPHVLRSWAARATLPPLLALCVAAAALWRRTVPRHVKIPDDRRAPPAGVLPNAPALVRRGVALRRRDAAIAAAEDDLRKGQIKLEVLRKEIESRLPSHNSIATLIEQDAQSAASKDRAVEPLAPRVVTPPFRQNVAGMTRANSATQLRSVGSFH